MGVKPGLMDGLALSEIFYGTLNMTKIHRASIYKV
jgi:hypothetical protein